MEKKIQRLLLFAFLLLSSVYFSANRFWISIANSNWNNTANWSTTSGGAGGASVPAAADIAIFDGAATGNGNCTLDAVVNVAGLQLNAGYGGSYIQGGFAITVGASNAVFSGGTFTGGSANITFNGNYTLSGTLFTTTTGFIEFFGGAYTFSSGSFAHNSGFARFKNTQSITITGTQIFNEVDFQTSSGHCVFAITGIMQINTKMTTSNSNQCRFSGAGSIELHGDIYLNNLYNGVSSHGASFNLKIIGTGNQTIYGSTTIYRSTMPNTTINKASGTLFLKDNITFENDYTYATGTVDYTTNTNRAIFANTKNISITGTHNLGDVEFYTGFGHCVFTFVGALNIVTTMSMTASTNQCRFSGLGSINLSGDVYFNNLYNGQSSHGASFNLNVNGAGNQTFNGNTTIYRSTIPNTIINKPSGTLFLKDFLTYEGDYTYQAGTVDYTTNSNLEIFTNTKNINITGVHTLGNVEFYTGFNHCVFTFVGALTIANTMSMTASTNQCRFSGAGSINLTGNVYFNNLYNGVSSHGASFNLYVNGTGNQTFNGNTTIYRSTLPNTTINKTSGTLFLKDFLTYEGDYTYQAGIVDYTTNSNKTIYTNTKNINITGAHNLGEVEFYTGFNHCVFTFVGALNIVTTMSMTASTNQCRFSGAGSINLIGNAYFNNLYNGQSSHGASFILYVNGTGNQTFNGNTTIYRSTLPNTIINKSSGTLFLKDFLTYEGDYTYQSGIVDYTTNTNKTIYTNTKNINITGAHNLGNVEFYTGFNHCVFTFVGALSIVTTMSLTASTNQCRFSGAGSINLIGDAYLNNLYGGQSSHGASFNFYINGTGNQIIYGNTTIYRSGLPNTTINKSSGILYLKDHITFENNYTFTAGTLDYTSFNNRVIFTITKNINIPATHDLGNIEFSSIYSHSAFSINNTLIANNTLYLTGGNQDRFVTGQLQAKSDVSVTNSYNGTASHANTVTLTINGVGSQTFTGSGATGTGRLPNIIITKPSGTLFLNSIITGEGSWTYNTGIIDASTYLSTVSFYVANNLDAQGTSSIMKFYNLNLADNTRRTLIGNCIVTNILSLGTGNIDLNSNKLSVYNSSTGAITNSSGYIKSEHTSNLSKLSWMMGSTTGAHIVPFGTNGGTAIPFTLDLTGGTIDTVIVSTYPTNAANVPLPLAPNTVTNLGNSSPFNNSANTVDRFWQIDKTGGSGTADLTFYATAGEVGAIANLKAEHWNTTTNLWDVLLPGQTSYALGAKVPNVTNFSPWTLSGNNSPLPVELVSFDAIKCGNEVCLNWKTASELNCDFYTIERASDALDFKELSRVKGSGTTLNTSNYVDIDNEPKSGINYYRLKQTDLNGDQKYFNTVVVNFEGHLNVSIFPNPSKGMFTIKSNTNEIDIKVVDILGRIVFEQKLSQTNGIIETSFDLSNLSNGTYNALINASGEVISRKLIKIGE